MSKTKIGFIFIGCVVILIGLTFAFEALDIVKFGLFEPKRENIKREVFENTKSYVHGVIQDLGKYYDEYRKADTGEKQAISEVIKMRFTEFEADKIPNQKLKEFLVEVRGY